MLLFPMWLIQYHDINMSEIWYISQGQDIQLLLNSLGPGDENIFISENYVTIGLGDGLLPVQSQATNSWQATDWTNHGIYWQ